MKAEVASRAAASSEPWLVKHPAEWRQIGIIAAYLGLLAAMYCAPACRNAPLFAAACCLSLLNAVVIHDHLHQGIFRSRRLNMLWRCVLSFGALYPASANVPSHNLVHHHVDFKRGYLLRTCAPRFRRPASRDVARAERSAPPIALSPRALRRAEAEAASV
ncbi:hypothetical protein [Sorangium sp. So ce1389]|uniref:hypothetical protein n=1 Tax=Sorangium sp. So ce1389 TaxID=3133336 RepID=UPI003F5F9086